MGLNEKTRDDRMSMIYEVNLTLDPREAEAFHTWLKHHIEEILQIEGFLKADIFHRDAQEDEEGALFTVQYHLTDRKAVDNYIQNHTARFREAGIRDFGHAFLEPAFRRILEHKETIELDG